MSRFVILKNGGDKIEIGRNFAEMRGCEKPHDF